MTFYLIKRQNSYSFEVLHISMKHETYLGIKFKISWNTINIQNILEVCDFKGNFTI